MTIVAADHLRQGDSETLRVWDPVVRAFHWSLVAAVFVALATSLVLPPTWVTLHIVSGTAALALVAARLVWGRLGPAFARFAGFVHGPREILAHAASLTRGGAPRHLGHNPLGGAMIVALLAAVALLGFTGVVVLGGTLKAGPLAFVTPFAAGEAFRAIHQFIAYALIGLIVAHIGGAIFESRRTHENLVMAMVDGRKVFRPGDVMPPPARSHPVLAAAIVAIVFAASAVTVSLFDGQPALGVPRSPLEPLYVSECGACHAPFHPSLLPSPSWSLILDHLDKHFGEDASLDPDTVDTLRDYLTANASEDYDTKAANRFGTVDPADPIRITATPFWRRVHGHIPDAVFAAKSVGAKSACQACHADAAERWLLSREHRHPKGSHRREIHSAYRPHRTPCRSRCGRRRCARRDGAAADDRPLRRARQKG